MRWNVVLTLLVLIGAIAPTAYRLLQNKLENAPQEAAGATPVQADQERREGCPGCDLANANFQGKDLSRHNYSAATLTQANLA
ncbi:MAG: hypothetical protein ICV62_09395, partial [Cyanobacteria bacterium Co-bin13]|nr:hypothetical protein [Cyanobacteria bacterium Co-bin13]